MGTTAEERESGVLGSIVVFVVVRDVGVSTLFVLELSGVGEVGEAGQLAVPPPSVDGE